jgi:MarR family transcriptional regulator, organic hydroperoxide resistance regulator
MDKTTSSLLFADTLQQLTYDLVRYSALCDRVCTEQLGITGSQGYTLLAIPDDGSISMNDLSQKMKLASSTMTRMVDQLVQRKLVDRQPDVDDRRVVRVQLTQRGSQAKAQLHGTLQAFFSQVLEAVPVGEREPMIHSLETLNQAIMSTLRSCCGPDQNL